jgi:hypothetical protein
MNNELEKIWKEALMAQFKVLPIICLEGLRTSRKNHSQDSLFLGQDLNLGPHLTVTFSTIVFMEGLLIYARKKRGPGIKQSQVLT